LRPVYTAPSEDAATERFLEFQEVWGRKYPAIVKPRLTRVVNRAYGAASRENGSANVRRGQSADPQMKRLTVSRITKH
jgi:hypothetical protein